MAEPTRRDSPNGLSPNHDLDVQKLHSLPSEQQDLYLLTFTSDLAKFVESLDADGASAHQIHVKKNLFKIISLTSPAPTRVIRNNLGRCFAGIFGKGNRKLLLESINELAGLVNTSKADNEVNTRQAAIHCLGAVYEAAGDSAIQFSTFICTTLLRSLKSTQNHAGLRASIYSSLGRLYVGIRGSADENTARDVWKQARTAAAGDKSLLVQCRACFCLQKLVHNTSFFDNSNDFEKLQSVIWKAMDSHSPAVRHSAASTFSTALVKSYSESPSSEQLIKRKPKKATKKGAMADGDDEGIERPDSPAPQKPATLLSFGLPDILRQLSNHYCRPATSNKTRAALALCYVKTLRALGEGIVENQYGNIARNLFNEILNHHAILSNRYRLLLTRQFIRIILEEVVGREILGESAQVRAAKFLVNEILKDYPQALKERPEPSKQTLIGALSTFSSLVSSLGDAVSIIAESCREALLQVLGHPSYSVQVYTAHCLRSFVFASPQQLLPCVTICLNTLNRELGLLSTARQSPRRCVGLANGLSAILSVSTDQPLYGSVDVFSRVLSQATTLLKSSSSSDVRVSCTQIQVAWILLGGLMTLGPNFVKIHTSQLLLLWKNALPKPLNKDNMSHRNLLELSFLAHVRECALGSILTFLEYNRRLLTVDVTKRLATMLHNTTTFLGGLPSKKTTEDISQRLSPALQLHDFDLMVRRRVLQCYARLIIDAPQGSSEALLQSNLLSLTISCFANPENYAPNSLSASIVSSSGTFDSIWDVGDNYGFGVTTLVNGFDLTPFPGQNDSEDRDHWISIHGTEAEIDSLLLSPVCSGREYDSILLYKDTQKAQKKLPDPPATQVVNAAIHLFAILLPLQSSRIQESVLEQLTSFLSDGSLQRDPARKVAMSVNIAMALLGALKVAIKETSLPSGNIRSEPVERLLKDLLRGFLIHPDHYIRNIAAQGLGRLSRVAGGNFTVKEVDELIEHIIANREPSARSGDALALGHIYAQLGGMAAGLHLKKILGVLNSLSSDPHPAVHFWALESISRLANSAGLNFAPYVTSTLGLLARLYITESHNDDVGSVMFSNLEVDLPTSAVLARCVDSVVNVLGPDLQDAFKARDLIMALIGQFQTEGTELVLIESLRCQEHLSLYAPGHMDFTAYVKRLQADLDSDFPSIRSTAVDGLHNLMRRDADGVLKVADPGLEDKLWLFLDKSPDYNGVKNIMRNWLHQTGLSHTALWVQRCNIVLTKITMKASSTPRPEPTTKSTTAADMQDEEVAGFAAAAGVAVDDDSTAGSSSQELLRWQTRSFAMDLMAQLLNMGARDAAAHEGSPVEAALQGKVADIIRIAFSASTTGVIALRIRGLQIINQLLKMFSNTPDPEYPDVPLLQQHQAQISSALNPAFGSDSSPELAAEAVNVCATFVAAGIVTEIKQMTRILSLLSSTLDSFSTNSESASIGELKGLSSNALVMVKMAIFSAWADLQIASSERKYLVDALKPRIAKLTPLWLASLREFARLRFEPDISTTSSATTALSGNLDSIYAALNRETLLQFYQSSWLRLVDAIASLIEEDSEFVFDALDGKTEFSEADGVNPKSPEINYRDEPVAFFFVLFGLAFEALVSRSGDSQANRGQTLEILSALKKILRPSVSGQAIYQEVVFSETMDMFDRLVLTESLNVQSVIVQIARNLCLEHPSARKGQAKPVEEERLSEDIDQLFELTRIIVLVLAGLVPKLTDDKSRVHHHLDEEATSLLTLSLSALVDASAVFPTIIETDLHACIIHIFTVILSNPSCQAHVVPQALPILKRFLTNITSLRSSPRTETSVQLRTALARFLTILKHAQLRETEAALPCEKNTLLACTILLSSASNAFSPADPLIPRFAAELADCLSSRLPSKVAASCSRSLLLYPKSTPADDALAAALLPQLLNFVGTPSETDGLDEAKSIISRALTAFLTSPTMSPDKLPIALAIIVPSLLAQAENEGKNSYKEVAERLLECAAAGQDAFRGVVGRLEAGDKGLLEEVIKEGGAKRENKVEEKEEPRIALKMDFGIGS